MVGYPPPDSGLRQKAQAAAETMKWIRIQIDAAPQRSSPLVGCDNIGISAQADGVLEGTGSHNMSPQGTGGAEALKIINECNMSFSEFLSGRQPRLAPHRDAVPAARSHVSLVAAR